MFNTLESRNDFVDKMLQHLKDKFDLSDTQIFVFGSFLTEDFEPGISDIDIGVYSENETKMYDIQCDLDIYIDKFNLKHDIVIMHLSDKLWINIPIMTYGKQLTQYENEDLFNYLLEMVKKYGFDTIKETTRK